LSGYRNALARRDRQLGVQLAERSAEAIEILRQPPRADVEIVGLADRSVVHGGDASDDHVLDLVSGERVDQRERLELIGQRVSRPRAMRSCSRAMNARSSSGVARRPPDSARIGVSSLLGGRGCRAAHAHRCSTDAVAAHARSSSPEASGDCQESD
jgi:hypothetical protein